MRLIIFTLLLAVCFDAGAYKAGHLDLSFGSGRGYVTTRTAAEGNIFNGSLGIAVQSDGKIVVVGAAQRTGGGAGDWDMVFVRYLTDGSVDPDFGDAGTPGIKKVQVGTSWTIGHELLIQSDGKILAVGVCQDTGEENKICLVRLNSNGGLDTDFGGGTGYVKQTLTGNGDGFGASLAIYDNKIIVGGAVTTDGYYRFAVLRFTSAGILDTTFNPAHGTVLQPGVVYTPITDRDAIATDLVIQSDGRIVLAGGVSNSGDLKAYGLVARYTASGELDTSFNDTGFKTLNPVSDSNAYAYSVLLQSDEKIIVTGAAGLTASSYLFAMRLKTNGQEDATFGTQGVAKKLFSGSAYEYDGVGLLQSDGKLILGGYIASGMATAYIVLMRFTADGQLDPSFGTEGLVTTSGIGFGSVLLALAKQSDGKILGCGGSGQMVARSAIEADVLVLRYLNLPSAISTTEIAQAKTLAPLICLGDSNVDSAVNFYNVFTQKYDDFLTTSSVGVACRS